jgi:rRNA maturation endonuclease Nob1
VYNFDAAAQQLAYAIHIEDSAAVRAVEEQRGYRCRSCQRIFCKACLESKAPRNAQGGKTCPHCGGSFDYLRD